MTRGPAFLPALGAVVIWGGMFPVADSVFDVIDPVPLSALRFTIATALMLLLLRAVEGPQSLRLQGRGRTVVLLGVVGFGGFNLLSFVGLSHTTPQHTALIVAMTPVLTVVARWLRDGERPSPGLLACVAGAFAGVGLVITDGDLASLEDGGAGDLLVLAGTICWVRYTLGVAQQDWSPLRFTALAAVPGSLAMVLVAVGGNAIGEIPAPDPAELGDILPALVYVTLFGALISNVLWNAGVGRLGASRAALFMNLTPVVTFAIQAMRGDEPGAVELAGAALTLAALVTANLLGRRQQRAYPTPVPSARA